jgi:probable phosphoglycerate mutase
MMPINIYMVRHGQTYLNSYARMQGWSDTPLTDQGVADGYAAGARLRNVRFSGAYSSDLTRAVKTAEYILQRNVQSEGLVAPVQLFQFREQFFGFFEGLPSDQSGQMIADKLNRTDLHSYADLMKALSQDEVLDAIHAADPTGDAEDAATFWARLDNGLDALRREHRDGDNILVVAHGSLIRNLTDRFGSHEQASVKIKNGAVTVWELTETDLHLQVYNDDETVF